MTLDLCPGLQPELLANKQQLLWALPGCFPHLELEYICRHVCTSPETVAHWTRLSNLFFVRNDRVRVKSRDLSIRTAYDG